MINPIAFATSLASAMRLKHTVASPSTMRIVARRKASSKDASEAPRQLDGIVQSAPLRLYHGGEYLELLLPLWHAALLVSITPAPSLNVQIIVMEF